MILKLHIFDLSKLCRSNTCRLNIQDIQAPLFYSLYVVVTAETWLVQCFRRRLLKCHQRRQRRQRQRLQLLRRHSWGVGHGTCLPSFDLCHAQATWPTFLQEALTVSAADDDNAPTSKAAEEGHRKRESFGTEVWCNGQAEPSASIVKGSEEGFFAELQQV